MRNYGYWANNIKTASAGGAQIEAVRDPVLAKVTNMNFRSFDLDYPGVKRAQVLLKDLAEFEKTGQMPALITMRLPNDHPSGTAAGTTAPLSALAVTHYAIGTTV